MDDSDDDEDEDDNEVNELHNNAIETPTPTLVAPPLEVDLEDTNVVDDSEKEEDEESEDAKKLNKRAKKRLKQQRLVLTCFKSAFRAVNTSSFTSK